MRHPLDLLDPLDLLGLLATRWHNRQHCQWLHGSIAPVRCPTRIPSWTLTLKTEAQCQSTAACRALNADSDGVLMALPLPTC